MLFIKQKIIHMIVISMIKYYFVTLLTLCALHTFAQKDTVYFLYKGSLYGKQDSTLNRSIRKKVEPDYRVLFEVKGKDNAVFYFDYHPVYNRKNLRNIRRILASKKVFFLSYLTELNEREFIAKFGYVYLNSGNFIFFLVPLLDANANVVPCFQVTFINEFLMLEE